jgi:hypothetical protein
LWPSDVKLFAINYKPGFPMLTSQAKRVRRIEKRCIGPVIEALRAGRISARSADTFLRLTPKKQALELERRLSEAHKRERKHAVVARVIREYLDQCGNQVDLLELNSRLQNMVPLQNFANLRKIR